jgi:hypothetical protein
VRISQFDVRKRGSEPDSYDVDLVVSAFDRKAEPKTAPKAARDGGAAPRGSAESEGDGEKNADETEQKE